MSQEQLKRGFRLGSSTEAKPSDPESLFRDLKSRDPAIQHLWSHQADILRAYDKNFVEMQDVAIELPTGTGKTLIGLLIADYRRRKFDNRVAYLCPTRQLAYQVGEHARRYGIRASVVLPRDYIGIDQYRLNKQVAITTYSSVFNSNPRISDAQTLIMDDAHSAEDYIAALWSVSISRYKHKALYNNILELLQPELGLYAVMLLDEETPLYADNSVDLVPQPSFLRYSVPLGDLLDNKLKDTDEGYSWSMIRGHLHACCLYIARSEILIRPIVAPTLTHRPFAEAKQRIYMSATLGEGGELERIIGVRRIERIPVPEGWDKQSSGRRLFLFPDLSLEDDQLLPLTVEATKQSERALVLTPTKKHVEFISGELSSNGITVLHARDIEESLEAFAKQRDTALVLANRYDGIDLPGDCCRLLVLNDIPGGTNLQEQFLLRRLSATSVLRDRIRTRLIQAVGRCTRNSTDYAAVLIIGQRLFDFCAASENRSGMHPELQAEIEFGIDNSTDMDLGDFVQLIQLMQAQSDEWRSADAEIVRRRTEKLRQPDPLATTLMRVAPLEVDFTYSLWSRNYREALQKAVEISGYLGGPELAPYRGWWYYLGGITAWLGSNEYDNHELGKKAAQLFGHAATCSKVVSWLAGLSEKIRLPNQPPIDVLAARACEAIRLQLEVIGLFGKKFETRLNSLEQQITDNESSPFEQGLTMLGNLLGFHAFHPNADSAPDSVWNLNGQLVFVFEAKSDEMPQDAISLATVRQALTHATWVRNHCNITPDAKILTIVVTPRRKIATEAQHNAEGLSYLQIDDLREFASELTATLRRIRAELSSTDDEAAIEQIHNEFSSAAMLPQDLIARFTGTPLNTLPN